MGTKGTWRRPPAISPAEEQAAWERVFGVREQRTSDIDEDRRSRNVRGYERLRPAGDGLDPWRIHPAEIVAIAPTPPAE